MAQQISLNAVAAAAQADVPYLALRRAEWTIDGWAFESADELAEALPAGARVFLTIGRGEIAPFLARTDVSFLLRSIEHLPDLPNHVSSHLARPPFTFDAETTLMREAGVTHLVTKNSGGALPAKLEAACALGVEIFCIAMPPAPTDVEIAPTVEEALRWVDNL